MKYLLLLLLLSCGKPKEAPTPEPTPPEETTPKEKTTPLEPVDDFFDVEKCEDDVDGEFISLELWSELNKKEKRRLIKLTVHRLNKGVKDEI
jgi:hypothetical protein